VAQVARLAGRNESATQQAGHEMRGVGGTTVEDCGCHGADVVVSGGRYGYTDYTNCDEQGRYWGIVLLALR
jgi:hypothetical protein